MFLENNFYFYWLNTLVDIIRVIFVRRCCKNIYLKFVFKKILKVRLDSKCTQNGAHFPLTQLDFSCCSFLRTGGQVPARDASAG